MLAKALRKFSGDRVALLRDYLSLFSGSAGRLVVSLVYFIALANTLPTSDFGIFATASGTGVMLSRLVSLGFNSPLYRIATVKPRLLRSIRRAISRRSSSRCRFCSLHPGWSISPFSIVMLLSCLLRWW